MIRYHHFDMSNQLNSRRPRQRLALTRQFQMTYFPDGSPALPPCYPGILDVPFRLVSRPITTLNPGPHPARGVPSTTTYLSMTFRNHRSSLVPWNWREMDTSPRGDQLFNGDLEDRYNPENSHRPIDRGNIETLLGR